MDGVSVVIVVAVLALIGWLAWLWRGLIGTREANALRAKDNEADRLHMLAVVAAKREVENVTVAALQQQVAELQRKVDTLNWKK